MEKNNIIDINDTSFIIKLQSDPQLLKITRSFFVFLLKFNYDEPNSTFIHKRDINVQDIFSKTIRFLDKKNIPYTLSPSALEYNKKITEQLNDFEHNLQEATDIKNKDFTEVSLAGFQRELKHYQSKGLSHLMAIHNGANFSVPGSGKTTVSYAYYKHLLDNKIVNKLLVIGPRSSFVPWQEEYVSCFGQEPNLKRVTGNIIKRRQIYDSAENYEIFLITYQTAANDIDDLISLCKIYKILIILDESHYIKRLNKGFWSTQILKLAPYAERKIILTGTPAPNSYEDLWSQINFRGYTLHTT